VTSIESIVARSGYPSSTSSSVDRDGSKSSSSFEQLSRSPPSSSASAGPRSPQNGNHSSSPSSVAAAVEEFSKSPPKEPSYLSSPSKRLQPSPSRAGEMAGNRRSMAEEPERDYQRGRNEKQTAPTPPHHHHTKDSNRHHHNDEPDVPSSKPPRSSSRPKNVVPTIIAPLIGDV